MPSDNEHSDDTSVLGKRALEAEDAPAPKEDESGKESLLISIGQSPVFLSFMS